MFDIVERNKCEPSRSESNTLKENLALKNCRPTQRSVKSLEYMKGRVSSSQFQEFRLLFQASVLACLTAPSAHQSTHMAPSRRRHESNPVEANVKWGKELAGQMYEATPP